MRSTRRAAFTVFDLITVVAILGLLLGLLFPWLVQMRRWAVRYESQNNLKHLGIAIHAYHDAHRQFPAGVDKNGFSATAYLLPYLEQDAVYKRINFNLPISAPVNVEVGKLRIPLLISPLDPVAVKSTLPSTNYLYCAGSENALEKNNGGFVPNAQLKFTQITDGMANTLAMGETLVGHSRQWPRDVQRQHVQLDKDALKKLNQDSGVQAFKDGKKLASNRGTSWLDGSFLQGTFTATRLLNDARPDVNCAGIGGLSGLRNLDKGTNVLMFDGSGALGE